METLAGEGRSLKPDTPEPDGDSNQERAKDRGTAGERKMCRKEGWREENTKRRGREFGQEQETEEEGTLMSL